jgi:hypothetical protein
LLAAPAGLQEGDIGEFEQRHPQEADQFDQPARWLDLPRFHRAPGLDLTGIGLLLGQRHGAEVPVVCTELLQVADLVDGFSKSAGAVTLRRGLQPLQVRRVGAGPSAVCGVDDFLGCCRWQGGIDRAEDLRLYRCKCVTSPVLQAARSWDQDAPGEQPLAGRLDQVIGVGRVGCLGQQGRGQRGFVVDFKFAQAQVGLGPELVLGKGLSALVDRPQAGDGRR